MKRRIISSVSSGLFLILVVFSAADVRTQTDAQFLNDFAADVNRSLPKRLVDADIRSTQTFCAFGCQSYFATAVLRLIGTTPGLVKQNINIPQLGQAIKAELLKDYCQTPARQRNISIQVYLTDTFGVDLGNVAYVQASDCPANSGTTASQSTTITNPAVSGNAQFLANYAAQTRKDMPLTVQDLNFWRASTFCPSGCENNYNGDFLVIYAKHLRLAKQNIPLSQLAQSFLPTLKDNYCNKSGGAPQRNITFQVQLTDMYNDPVGELARLTPASCAVNAAPNVPGISAAGSSVEQQLWDAVKNSNRVQDFQTYLTDYPNGQYASVARLKISQLGGIVQQTPTFPTNPNPSVKPHFACRRQRRGAVLGFGKKQQSGTGLSKLS